MSQIARSSQLGRSPSLPFDAEFLSFCLHMEEGCSKCILEFDGCEEMKDPSLLFSVQGRIRETFRTVFAWFPFVHYDSTEDCFLCETPHEWGWVSPYLLMATPLKDAAAMQLFIEGDRPKLLIDSDRPHKEDE